MPSNWSWIEDRQWARSLITTNWKTISGLKRVMTWGLEVRTENFGAGSSLMGEIFLTGSLDGELTMSIREETV